MLDFSKMLASLAGFWRDEKGNEVVTWVVIAALAVVIAVALLGGIDTATSNAVSFISDQVESVIASS